MNARKRKALTQPIYLVGLNYDTSFLTFHIVGSQKRVYKICYYSKDRPTCTCPDAVQRQVYCKHIHFVACKILHVDPQYWEEGEDDRGHDLAKLYHDILARLPHLNVQAPDELGTRYKDFLAKENVTIATDTAAYRVKVRNNECCICFTTFDEDGSELKTCRQCLNAVHQHCWQQWEIINGTKNFSRCVYCRNLISNVDATQHLRLAGTRDEYGVQL